MGEPPARGLWRAHPPTTCADDALRPDHRRSIEDAGDRSANRRVWCEPYLSDSARRAPGAREIRDLSDPIIARSAGTAPAFSIHASGSSPEVRSSGSRANVQDSTLSDDHLRGLANDPLRKSSSVAMTPPSSPKVEGSGTALCVACWKFNGLPVISGP